MIVFYIKFYKNIHQNAGNMSQNFLGKLNTLYIYKNKNKNKHKNKNKNEFITITETMMEIIHY